MPVIHFISDLHLTPKRPQTVAALGTYLAGPARQAQALYILGDLFDAWPGDDCLIDPAVHGITQLIAQTAAAGVAIYLLCGNRDFLLGQDFARSAQLTLIEDGYRLSLGGADYLLLHGDSLCTDDHAYQQFRSMVRNPAWRAAVLAKTLAERLQMAAEIRMQSEGSKQDKSEEIMDVNDAAVATLLREHGYPHLIHGHTHRPASHLHQVDAHHCQRWVLSDWQDRAQWLQWTEGAGLQPCTL